MLSSTALGVPRFSMTSDRRSSWTRRRSFPKLLRARSAETTMLSLLRVRSIENLLFQLSELYSSERKPSSTAALLRAGKSLGGAAGRLPGVTLVSPLLRLVRAFADLQE